MIRILTYKEHPQGKAIWDRYLYLVAYLLPFAPKDVLGSDVLEVDGETITASNYYQKSGKRPRNRTDKYKKMLKKYGLDDKAEPSLEQDQLLTARLIQSASQDLYIYLYQVADGEGEPATLPSVRKENLRTLLTVKMDELPPELEKIGAIDKDRGKDLEEVFRYAPFSAHPYAAKLLETMDVNVCPYCNRLYTMTITGSEGKSRPQFDHYKSKSKYPYFAVSLMNLVPSCGLCNQGKKDRDEAVLYPYSDEMGLDAVFRTKIETGVNYLTGRRDALDEFSVELDIAESLSKELREKIRFSDEFFNLTKLYNKHKDYILYLFWKNYIFNDEYLQMLCQEFPDAFTSLEDVKSMIYLMDIDQPQWGRRPLGKLTHDIDAEINKNLCSKIRLSK